MDILKSIRRKEPWRGPLLAELLVAGCAGIEPYEPYDYRQDGPKQGLISGEAGEFVIYRRTAEPDAGSEEGRESDNTPTDESQETDSEERR